MLNRTIYKCAIYFVALVVLSFILGCKKAPNPAFELSMDVPISINAGLSTGITHVFQQFNVPTFFEQSSNASGVSLDNVSSIVASYDVFKSTSGNTDLSFIEAIYVHAITNVQEDERLELFYLDQNKLINHDEIGLLPTLSELKNILSEDVVNLEFNFVFRQFVPNNFQGVHEMRFSVFED